MPNRKQEGTAEQPDPRYATLEDPPKGGAKASPSNDCRPDVCKIDDHGEKWAGLTNYTCTRCGFATVDAEAARRRNPAAFAKK